MEILLECICPNLIPPAPEFCKDGRVVLVINECNCVSGYSCEGIDSSFKIAPWGYHFGCNYVSQGAAWDYNNPPPQVCGFIPNSCPKNEPFVIANLDTGAWPDGSLKGSFVCSESMPPK